MKSRVYTLEKKMIAQVQYFETLYKVKAQDGTAIFTGSEEMARKILRTLNSETKTRKVKR